VAHLFSVVNLGLTQDDVDLTTGEGEVKIGGGGVDLSLMGDKGDETAPHRLNI